MVLKFLVFSAQKRRDTNFEIHEKYPIRHSPCHIDFLLNKMTSTLKNYD